MTTTIPAGAQPASVDRPGARSRPWTRGRTPAAPAGPTVEQYLTGWLAGRQTLRPSTRLSYGIHLERYLIPKLGQLPLAALTVTDIEAMFSQIAATPDRTGRPSGPATLKRINATLMSALSAAVRRGQLDRNPAVHVDLASALRQRMRVWTAVQLAEFLDATSTDPLQELFVLLAVTGLRRGEAVGLRWVDVDLDQGLLQVEQQIVAVATQRHTGPPKTANGRRSIALPARLVEALRRYSARQQVEQQAAGALWVDTGLLYTTALGEALNPAWVSRHFDRLVATSGLLPIRLHDLRHTSASLGLASGESLLEVSRRLGHSSIMVTGDIYSHVSPATAMRSAERLEQLINGARTRRQPHPRPSRTGGNRPPTP